MISHRLSSLSPRGLAIVMFGLVFGSACGLIGFFYFEAVQFRTMTVREHVGDLARTAVTVVDIDLHESLVSPDQFMSDDYRRALAPLVKWDLSQPLIEYVYTIRDVHGRESVVLQTANDPAVYQQQSARGHPPNRVRLLDEYRAPANSAAARPALREGKVFVFPEPYTDAQFGTCLEARAPLFNRAGEYVGYLVIDYSVELLKERMGQLYRIALAGLGLALAMSLVLARLAYDLRRRAIETLAQVQAAEAATREQRDIATKANQAKSELLAIASHDLKNPLSAIAGMSGLMLQEKRILPESPAVLEDIATLETIHASAKHVSEIVRGILMSEGLEQGGLPFHPVRVDLGALCEKIVRFNASAAKKKAIIVKSEIGSGIVTTADAKLLHEAFDNYLSNAIKYSPTGKSVVARAALVEGDSVIEFSVRDEGPGLSAEDQKKLFRKFQKLTARPTGGETSTGLGLSIVKKIAELHQGCVGCDSQLGQGARFWIRLPLAPTATVAN
jgi:signal transduction histidine kinase